jgi:lipocalin-like protein
METRPKRASIKTSLLFSILLGAGMAAFAQNGAKVGAAHAQPGARERLIGTWRVVSAGTLRSDGKLEPFPEYGPNPLGYLIYDTTGHMCVSLANPNHPHWANPEKPTDAERLRSYDAFFAYCGSYEVREKESLVIHRPEMGSWPHYIGTDQPRHFTLEGDRLILSDEETPPGGERRRYQITWERVRSNKQ